MICKEIEESENLIATIKNTISAADESRAQFEAIEESLLWGR